MTIIDTRKDFLKLIFLHLGDPNSLWKYSRNCFNLFPKWRFENRITILRMYQFWSSSPAAVGVLIVQQLLHVCSPLPDPLKQTQRLDENLVTVQKAGTRAFSNQHGHILWPHNNLWSDYLQPWIVQGHNWALLPPMPWVISVLCSGRSQLHSLIFTTSFAMVVIDPFQFQVRVVTHPCIQIAILELS